MAFVHANDSALVCVYISCIVSIEAAGANDQWRGGSGGGGLASSLARPPSIVVKDSKSSRARMGIIMHGRTPSSYLNPPAV